MQITPRSHDPKRRTRYPGKLLACLTDNDVRALVSGKLDAAARVEIDTHLDECALCRELVAAADGKPDTQPHTLQFGRYAVLEQLGAEGNGVVYAAYDPQLDRRVLLKLLDSSQAIAPGQSERLLRDAKTMASLSHPNVVQVHDAGELHGQVFITTALPDDPSLTEWLKAARHPWDEVLRVFIQAGRGLAAIEAAGVHGDFQPDNVAVGDRIEGAQPEVRIAEFGNFKNEFAKSARADQQSFSLALEKALAGDARVPGRLRRVLQRGRAVRPELRFKSLHKLLDALEANPWISWRRAGALLVAVAALAAVVVGARLQANLRARTCKGAREKLAGVWDAEVRARGKAAFGASTLPFADTSWTLAEQSLNRYAEGWSAMRTEACEATSVRHQQPPDLLDLRMQCLDDRLSSLRATAEVLATGEPRAITHAAGLVVSLPALRGCANEAALRSPTAPSAAQKPEVEKIRAQIHVLHAQAGAGQTPLEPAKQQVFAAQQLGYAPVQAEALVALAQVQESAGDMPGALQTYTRAAAFALETKNDRALLDAWLAVLDVDLRLAQLDQADAAAVQASAAASRLPDESSAQGALSSELAYLALSHDQLELAQSRADQAVAFLSEHAENAQAAIEALSVQSQAYEQRGLWDQAITSSTRGLQLSQDLYGPNHPSVADGEREVGSMLSHAGRISEAQPHLEHALAILEGLFGPDNPAIADALEALASNLINTDSPRALGLFNRALAIQRTATTNDESTQVAHLHYLIAAAEERAGKYADAEAELKQALALERKLAPDPDDLSAATFEAELAGVYLHAGKFDEARKLLAHALATQDKMHGPDEEETGDAVYSLAKLELAQKHLAIAKKLCERALAIAEKNRPGDSAESLDRELTLAEIDLGLGEPDAARPRLERLAAFGKPADGQARIDVARADFLLAQALWDNPKERPRAQKLLEMAQANYVSRGEVTVDDRKVLQSWIAKH